MYPEKLTPHKQTQYFHWEFFKNPLDLSKTFIEKDYQTGMHEQEFFEINIVTKGKGMHYIQNSRTPATFGDVFIVPPHVDHGYFGGKGFDVCHVLISDDFINKYIADLQQLPCFFDLFSAEPLMRAVAKNPLHLHLNTEQFDSVYKTILELLDCQDDDNPYECLTRTSQTIIFITLLCKIYSTNSSSIHLTSADESFMKSISYIHEHYNKKITIDDLVKIAQLSRSAYIKKFKSICKMTPTSYLGKRRIEAAENLLKNTQLSITEIAYRTGFYDSAHFTKTFETENKISPLAFRKKYSKKHF